MSAGAPYLQQKLINCGNIINFAASAKKCILASGFSGHRKLYNIINRDFVIASFLENFKSIGSAQINSSLHCDNFLFCFNSATMAMQCTAHHLKMANNLRWKTRHRRQQQTPHAPNDQLNYINQLTLAYLWLGHVVVRRVPCQDYTG